MGKQVKEKGISQEGAKGGMQAQGKAAGGRQGGRAAQPRHSIVIWLILAAIIVAVIVFARGFILSAAILPLLYQYWIYRGQSGKNALAIFALAYLGMSHFIQGQKAGFGTVEGLLYLIFALVYFGGIALLFQAKNRVMQAKEAEKAAQQHEGPADTPPRAGDEPPYTQDDEEEIEILVEEAPDSAQDRPAHD